MTKQTDLEALAARCEAATGPDHVLSEHISVAVIADPDAYDWNAHKWLDYTASIDAALTLVPEGWRIGLEDNASCDEPGKVYAWCWPFESGYDPDWQMGQEGQQSNPDAVKGYAESRANAVAAAALRARSTNGEK